MKKARRRGQGLIEYALIILMLIGLVSGVAIIIKPPILSIFTCVDSSLGCDSGSSPSAGPSGGGQGGILTSITVTPASQTVGIYAHQQFRATGHYSDNTVGDVTEAVTWTSGDSTVASINSLSGEAIAVGAGTANISASEISLSGSATVTVDNPCGPAVNTLVGHDDNGSPTAAFGVALPMSRATAGDNGSATFCGVAGQRISAEVWNVPNYTAVSITGVGGPVASGQFDPYNNPWFSGVLTLPADGAYSLTIVAGGNSLGNFDAEVWNVTDLNPSTAANCLPVDASITTPGQNVRINFKGSATANQRVSVYAKVNSYSSYNYAPFSVTDPYGHSLASGFSTSYYHNWFSGVLALAANGLYSVNITPGGPTGTFTVWTCTVADLHLAASIGGPPVTAPITIPGQNANITFAGLANQHVDITGSIGDLHFVNDDTDYDGTANYSLIGPGGPSDVVWRSQTFGHSGGSFDTGRLLLPTSGTYTLFFDPAEANLASSTVRIIDADRQIMEKITDSCATSPTEGGYVIREAPSMGSTREGGVGTNVHMRVYIPTITGANWASQYSQAYCTTPAEGDQWYQIAEGAYAGYYIFAGALDGGQILPPTPGPEISSGDITGFDNGFTLPGTALTFVDLQVTTGALYGGTYGLNWQCGGNGPIWLSSSPLVNGHNLFIIPASYVSGGGCRVWPDASMYWAVGWSASGTWSQAAP